MTEAIKSLNKIVESKYTELTPRAKKLAEYVIANPEKAVFMTTRKLAKQVGVSEATVVRFVRQLEFSNYSSFISAIKTLIDTELTLIDRGKLIPPNLSEDAELERITYQDIENIRCMSKNLNLSEVKKVRKILINSESLHILGTRLSYAPAYYFGWLMAKLRENVHVHDASDKTNVDKIFFVSKKSTVIIVATSRYPNELINMGKLVKRLQLKMILLSDSESCPLVPFADYTLLAPQGGIPFLGNPASMMTLINYLAHSLSSEMGSELKAHQEKLEQSYLENDILFFY